MPDLSTITTASIVLLLLSAAYFFYRDDEIPLVLSGLGFLIIERASLIGKGKADWVSFDYWGVAFDFSHEAVLKACLYIFLGTAILAGTYMLCRRRSATDWLDVESIWCSFLHAHQLKIWIGLAAFLPINALAMGVLHRDFVEESRITNNYAVLFGMAGSSFIIAFVILARSLHSKSNVRFLCYGIAGALGFASISFSLRFQFLGWAILLLIILAQPLRPWLRLGAYAIGFGLVAVLFSTIGVLRHDWAQEATWKERIDFGLESLTTAGDINFVDGMVMLMQVKPEIVPYSYGGEHLQILLRPIPRAVWPGKPIGGWHQELAQAVGSEPFQTGISPSIFGSFYAEAGLSGIVFFSVLYGWLLAKCTNWIARLQSSLNAVLKGVVIAGIFAIVRGGDLAGTFAFVGMSYWPIALFVFHYCKFASPLMAQAAMLEQSSTLAAPLHSTFGTAALSARDGRHAL